MMISQGADLQHGKCMVDVVADTVVEAAGSYVSVIRAVRDWPVVRRRTEGLVVVLAGAMDETCVEVKVK